MEIKKHKTYIAISLIIILFALLFFSGIAVGKNVVADDYESKGDYWLSRVEDAKWSTSIATTRANVAQAYYLKAILKELQKMNEGNRK